MSSRLDRVSSILKREIANLLLFKINDKNLRLLSILEVDISPDLKNAKVYYSQILNSDEEKQKTRKALQKACKFIKFEVGKHLTLNTVPNLRFIYDDSLERGDKILTKIKNLENE